MSERSERASRLSSARERAAERSEVRVRASGASEPVGSAARTRARNGRAALVLNATYEPLCVVSQRRAVVLVLTSRAVCVSDGEGFLHSERQVMPIPSVVRLNRYVRVPYRAHVGLTRRAVFARDRWRCAYCEGPAETIDHVMPRSRGGEHIWENVVAACARCNHVKGDRTPAELGWRLPSSPAAPKGAAWRILGHRSPDPRWLDWLGWHGGTIVEATA